MSLFNKAKGYFLGDPQGQAVSAPISSQEATASAPRVQRVTPLRSRRPVESAMEIHSLDPKSFEDSQELAAWFREGYPVIVNIAALSESDAKKMFYFMLGLKEGLSGHIKRITPKVFVMTPENVHLNDEDELNGDSDDLVQP